MSSHRQEHIMRKLITAAFSLAVVLAVGCGSKSSSPTPDSKQGTPTPGAATAKPKDMIVGRWEAVEPKELAMAALMYEFNTNGTVRASMSSNVGVGAPPLFASG